MNVIEELEQEEAKRLTAGKKIPVFNISIPWVWGNKPDSRYLDGAEFKDATKFIVRQLRECIKFIEERTGKAYDFDKLCEVMSYTKEAGRLRMEAMALCRAKPAPARTWSCSLKPRATVLCGPPWK